MLFFFVVIPKKCELSFPFCRKQDGNDVDKYDLNHPKLKRRPFMTLNVLVVGKFHNNFSDLSEQNDSVLYERDQDDPDLLIDAVRSTIYWTKCSLTHKLIGILNHIRIVPAKRSPPPMNRHSFCVNVENCSLNRTSKSCPNCLSVILNAFYGLATAFQDLNTICHKVTMSKIYLGQSSHYKTFR